MRALLGVPFPVEILSFRQFVPTPARSLLSPVLGEGFPTKIDYGKKLGPLTSLLEDLAR